MPTAKPWTCGGAARGWGFARGGSWPLPSANALAFLLAAGCCLQPAAAGTRGRWVSSCWLRDGRLAGWTGGGACLVGVLTLGCVRPSKKKRRRWRWAGRKSQLDKEAAELSAAESGDSSVPDSFKPGGGPPAARPQCIFHGLHLRFEELRSELPRLAAEGYDAVQLPPAQLCRPGDLGREWFLRYQPLRYGVIDPALGGEAALQHLCRDATELGIMVIADCVFNHTAVVATCAEWKAAQEDERLLEDLKCRLDNTFSPELNRHDFQWPWVCLEGSKWDDPNYMYEGWGCGEWSELRWCPKVIEVHCNHLRALLRCGVKGFRMDAAKHMRPRHIHRYVEFLQEHGAFVYVEVLSLQRDVHVQYEVLGNGSSHVLSTDFHAASTLRAALRDADTSALLPRLGPLSRSAAEAVRFVRNHDTVLNEPGAICGIDWRGAEEAQAAWAFLLALPGGCALVYSEDRLLHTIRRAVAFRRLLAERAAADREAQDLKSKKSNGSCVQTQVTAWPPPSYSLVLVVPTGPRGNPLGIVAVNFAQRGAVPLQLPAHLAGLKIAEVLGGQRAAGKWQPLLGEALVASGAPHAVVVPANNARFFIVAETPSPPEAQPGPQGALPAPGGCGVQVFSLLYFSGWDSPHLHFGIQGQWTKVPGWPLVASPPPPPGLGGAQMGGGLGTKRQGRWWRVDVPLPEAGCPAEFVLNDGKGASEAARWDKSPQNKNYEIPGSGTYLLMSGKLQRLGGSA